MAQDRINLQNVAAVPGTQSRPVNFDSSGARLSGTLFTPEAPDGPRPAVVVTGAWTTVKEQMAGTYARELAARGYVALAFDSTGWGESGGAPRYVEDPSVKTADIHAAAAFLTTLDEVDAGAVSCRPQAQPTATLSCIRHLITPRKTGA